MGIGGRATRNSLRHGIILTNILNRVIDSSIFSKYVHISKHDICTYLSGTFDMFVVHIPT